MNGAEDKIHGYDDGEAEPERKEKRELINEKIDEVEAVQQLIELGLYK